MKKKPITTKPISSPHATEMLYARELSALIRQMAKEYASALTVYKQKQEQIAVDDASGSWLTTEVEEHLRKLGDRWAERFKEFAENKSPAMVKKTLRQTDVQLKSTLKDWFSVERMTLIAETIPTPLRQSMKAHVAENVSLIKSIPAQYHERIIGAVTRAITGGSSYRELVTEIQSYQRKEIRRAELIARDQVHKMSTTMTMRRCEQLGIKRMQWLHSGAVREPRPYHMRKWDGHSGTKDGHPNGLNGFIFDLSNPPVIQEAKGKQLEVRGLPGKLPFCRCQMVPIIDVE